MKAFKIDIYDCEYEDEFNFRHLNYIKCVSSSVYESEKSAGEITDDIRALNSYARIDLISAENETPLIRFATVYGKGIDELTGFLKKECKLVEVENTDDFNPSATSDHILSFYGRSDTAHVLSEALYDNIKDKLPVNGTLTKGITIYNWMTNSPYMINLILYLKRDLDDAETEKLHEFLKEKNYTYKTVQFNLSRIHSFLVENRINPDTLRPTYAKITYENPNFVFSGRYIDHYIIVDPREDTISNSITKLK